MRAPIRKLAVLAVTALAVTPSAFAAVGRTPGIFDVSSYGSATYTVPIAVPPGPRGVQPSIALTYDSKYGNGVLGVGWSLSGLSSIERCVRTEAQDGQRDTIVMGPADRFCLNGNRLRLVTSGETYGAPNTVYQTETADFSEVTAYGTASGGDGPEYFIARGKDGLIYEFGRTPDSRVIPENRTSVLRWKLNKVRDRAGTNGNSYTIKYNATDYSKYSAHAVPILISWGPTSAGGSTYTYKMVFNYEARQPDDWQNGWVAGSPAYNRQRLANITIESSASESAVVIKKYSFGYEIGPSTKYSRLTSITECADSSETDCLNPTEFTYQAGELEGTKGSGTAPTGTSIDRSYDFNGDGRGDLLYASSGTRAVALSLGAGFKSPISTGVAATAPIIVDQLIPGRDSIVINDGGTLKHLVLNSAETGFTVTTLSIAHPAGIIPQSVDVDGNTLADLVWMVSVRPPPSLRRHSVLR